MAFFSDITVYLTFCCRFKISQKRWTSM